MSGTNTAKADVLAFRAGLVRLFSLLTALTLESLSNHSPSGEEVEASDTRLDQLKIIDIDGLDDDALEMLRTSDCPVELVIKWIQALCLDNVDKGVLTVAPPVLALGFQPWADIRFFRNCLLQCQKEERERATAIT